MKKKCEYMTIKDITVFYFKKKKKIQSYKLTAGITKKNRLRKYFLKIIVLN